MIEIKPKKLINTPLIKLKTKAAIEYCKKHNLEFIITDVEIVPLTLIKELIDNNNIKFTKRTMEKYNKWILENYGLQ